MTLLTILWVAFCWGGGGGGNPVFSLSVLSGYLFILIIKRISRGPVYHTKWEHKVLYNNTNDRHAHARICVGWGDRHGMKNNLEMIIKQVRLEGGFKRGGRIRVANLRQIVWNRWASIRKRSFTKCFCVYTRGIAFSRIVHTPPCATTTHLKLSEAQPDTLKQRQYE